MPSQRRPGLASIHIYVDLEEGKAFSAACEQNGETMTAVLKAYIRGYTKRNQPRGSRSNHDPELPADRH